MDPVRNPFAPGAGKRPPELAGREQVMSDARTALQRAILGRDARSQILLGLRGVGKTVLLVEIDKAARGFGHLTSFIEAPESKSLAELIVPRANQILEKLSLIEGAKVATHKALRALRSFASTFKFSYGDIGISVDPLDGVSDSGNLEYDLSELFEQIGLAAKSAGKAWTLLIDEVQYITETDLAALIVAIHKTNQANLPVLFFGAGLPQVAALSGNAKSYAERLFHYPKIGPLDRNAARKAIELPIEAEGERISAEAIAAIFGHTQGYPYFLQEWGFQAWEDAEQSPITVQDIELASTRAIARLDEGFFKVRFDRLTPKEREYVFAMAQLGKGPYRSSDVAEILKIKVQGLSIRRRDIIKKGMIYSPQHGDIAFTVPMFEDYLNRIRSGA